MKNDYLTDMIIEIVSAASWSVMEIGREKKYFIAYAHNAMDTHMEKASTLM